MRNAKELGETEGRGEKENPVRFITPICIMGLIGPRCVFSGVGVWKCEGGVIAGGI